MKNHYPRKIVHLSPPDRPRSFGLKNQEGSLVYLAWGDRYFGRDPVPVYLHDSWSYTVILKGVSVLMIGQERHPINPGEAVLVGPDCPMGWYGRELKSKSTVLGWSWRKTPFFLDEGSSSDHWWRFRLSKETVRRLQDLHRLCRQEVELSDGASAHALDALRTVLDTEFFRHIKVKRTLNADSLRFQTAVRWMEEILEASKPMHRLCEYLQVSPATLKVLFHRKAKTSPFAYFQTLKFAHAKKLLQEGTSVKAVALTLGYRHPNHFSRAFSEYFEKTARCFLGASSMPCAAVQA